MYINLDVVMRLVLIGLVVAGIGALITLAMLFKNLIQTMHSLTGALDLLQRDLAKLEGPLDTVDALSTTVNEIQTSAKRAANTAIDTFSTSSQRIMNWVDAKTTIKDDSHGPATEPESHSAPEAIEEKTQNKGKEDHSDHSDQSDQGPKGDFKPIKPENSPASSQQPQTAQKAEPKEPAVKEQTKTEESSQDPASETAKPKESTADPVEVKADVKPATPPVPQPAKNNESQPSVEEVQMVEEIMIGIPKETIHPREETLSENESKEEKK